ncbi:MAG: hypothetical protein U0984_05260 [Prosthecobacter sp.]|nr:hypothetical protein [Prosthecobacter sp.]
MVDDLLSPERDSLADLPEGESVGITVFHVKFTGWEWFFRQCETLAVIHTEKSRSAMVAYVDQYMTGRSGRVIFFGENGEMEAEKKFPVRPFHVEAVVHLVPAEPGGGSPP